MPTQSTVFHFNQFASKAIQTVVIVCLMVAFTQAPLLSQENKTLELAAVKLTKAEFARFTTGSGWDDSFSLLSHPSIYISKVVDKRGKTSSRFTAEVTKPGWLLMLQVGHALSKDEYKDSGLSGDITFQPPKTLEKQGWQALASTKLDNHPMILYKKEVKVGEKVDFPVQLNRGPFLITSKNADFLKEVSAFPVIPAEQALAGNSTAQPAALGSQPAASPNAGGGLFGSLLGMARNLTGNTGFQQAPSRTAAAPKADKKSLFIQTVDLQGVKCPIERKSAKRDFHIEYLDGVLFFHTQEASEIFVENMKKSSAPANYQLFLTGQAKQIKCPLTGRDMDLEHRLNVGKEKSVAFASRSSLRKLQNKEASYKLKKIFGDTAFKRGFEIKIPKVIPSALQPDEELIKKEVKTRNQESKRASFKLRRDRDEDRRGNSRRRD